MSIENEENPIPESERKLFVAGVSWSTTDDGFYSFFARHGNLQNAMIMRDRDGKTRGFGFVIYKDLESVQTVLNTSYELDGRKLDIKMAVSREEMAQNLNRPHSNKVYVAGLAWECTEESLAKEFSKFGSVSSTMIQKDKFTGRSRGFGFVIFDEAESVEKCLAGSEGMEMSGRRLDVKRALAKGSANLLFPETSGKSKKIYVAGISDGITEEDLKTYFSTFGDLEECYIQKDRATGESRGFGFITFTEFAAAGNALKTLSHDVNGKGNVDVKMARPKPGDLRRPAAAAAAAGRGGPPFGGRPVGRFAGGPMYPQRGGPAYGGYGYPRPHINPHFPPSYGAYHAPPASSAPPAGGPPSYYGVPQNSYAPPATGASAGAPTPGAYPGMPSSAYDQWPGFAGAVAGEAAGAGSWSGRDSHAASDSNYGSSWSAAGAEDKRWGGAQGAYEGSAASSYSGYNRGAARGARAYHPYGRS